MDTVTNGNKLLREILLVGYGQTCPHLPRSPQPCPHLPRSRRGVSGWYVVYRHVKIVKNESLVK